jgi:hypothetical protein
MIRGILFRQALEKFLKSPVAQNARVKPLASRDKKLDEVKLYEGSSILQLAACGLSLDACCSGLDACRLLLEELGA